MQKKVNKEKSMLRIGNNEYINKAQALLQLYIDEFEKE